ncbi:hypothetical protein GQ44DRAFT_826831 [Phaeosphaeriaceae sp. PMI808]|nr:hypothetical protein GQ44DRAFT_826831 [Phaeosphaeriaceae sp. PMI808]
MKIMHLMPKMIRDAITLVQRIDETYLWIDALYIIQDDSADKAVQIDAMGQIYRESILCIQAVCGTNATHGLPGVKPGSRNVQQFAARVPTQQGNLLLSNQLPYSDFVQKSTWMNQSFISASILALRRTRTAATTGSQSAQKIAKCSSSKLNTSLSWQKISRNSNFDIYAFIVFDYTKRSITKEEDTERALQDVLDIFAGLHRATWIFGIPDTANESGLMWCPVGSAVRRLDEKGMPLFPS